MTDQGHQTSIQDANLEAAKWLAVLAMTIDHAGKIWLLDWFDETHAFGRLAFPLFVAIAGLRLADRPARALGYLKRLIPWALVSQPVYVLAGKDWWDLNILVTLAAGIAIVAGAGAWRETKRPAGIAALLTALLVAPWCEFGIAGVLALPLFVALAGPPEARRLWLAGPMGVFANIVPSPPMLVPVDLFALGATPALYLSRHLGRTLPRLPPHAFYAWYPLHLFALDRLDRLL